MIARLLTQLEKHSATLATFGGACLLLLSVLVSRGGMLHPEAFSFLPGYLDESRSLARRIFDPATNDFGMYQARELSYFFDWIDCRFIAFCTTSGTPHFLSLSHYFFSMAIAFALWRLSSVLAMPRLGRALLVLLFLSSPMVLLGGDYFRSAKIGTAACVMFACWLYAAVIMSPSNTGARVRLTGLAIALFGAGLFDRQGVFFVLVACVLQLLRFAVHRHHRDGVFLALFVAISLALQLYNRLLAPALVSHFNAYRPSFDFQQIGSLLELASNGRGSLFFFHGPSLAFKYPGMLLGGLPWVLVAVAWLMMIVSITRAHPGSDRIQPGWTPTLRFGDKLWPLWLVLALMVMTALMAVHVPPVILPEFSLIYYPLPTVVAACAGLALGLARLPAAHRPIAFVAISVLVLANTAQVADHRRTLHRGTYAAAYERSPGLLAALRAASRLPVGERSRAWESSSPTVVPSEARSALAAILGEPSVFTKP